MFDELSEGTYRGALGVKGFKFVAMRAQELTLEFGVSSVVVSVPGRGGYPVPGEGEGVDGKEYKEGILAQRGDDGAFVELETDGHGLPLEPRAHGAPPRIDGVWLVFEDAEFTFLGASCLQADIMCGISPVDADEGRKLIRR
jgi:hypothetical protein